MANLVDTHCHLDILGDIPEMVKKAAQVGVTKIINPATNSESARNIIEIAAEFPQVYAAAAIHPVDTDTEKSWSEYPEDEVRSIDALLQGHCCGIDQQDTQQVIAIGECGLDYKYAETDKQKNIQVQLFKQHVNWAEAYQLPLIIHNRGAQNELIDIIQKATKPVRGVFHCFTGSKKLVKRILDLPDFYFGIGGLVTFDTGLQEVVKTISLERIILETDAPYLTPKPIKDTEPWPNQPAYITHTAQKLTDLFNVDLDTIADQTTHNAQTLFNI